MTHKEPNHEKLDPDKLYKYFDRLPASEKYPFFKRIFTHKKELNVDWFPMITDHRNSLSPEENMAICEDFLSWFPQQFPESYEQDFGYIEEDLSNYYLQIGNIEGLSAIVQKAKLYAVKSIDILTIRLYWQLLYHGCYDLVLDYAKAAIKETLYAEELLYNEELPFTQCLYYNALQEIYEHFKSTGSFDYSKVENIINEYELDIDEEILQWELQSIQNDLEVDTVLKQFRADYRWGNFSLGTQFIKYMHDQYSIHFMYSIEIWGLIAEKNFFGVSKHSRDFFYVDLAKMEESLKNRIDFIFERNKLEIFGKVWAYNYIFDFLETTGLLSSAAAVEMQENILYLKNSMLLFADKDLWKMNFILKWPKISQQETFSTLFEEVFRHKPRKAKSIINSYIKSLPVNARITSETASESAVKKNKYNQDFMGYKAAPSTRKADICGRNEPCPCGSGKKYKKCCMGK